MHVAHRLQYTTLINDKVKCTSEGFCFVVHFAIIAVHVDDLKDLQIKKGWEP